MENEVWKDVIGYECLYQISNLGNVKSFKRNKNGTYLKPGINSKGYKGVILYKKGIGKNKQIHVLVAESFLNHKPCGHKLVIDHVNNDKLNNNIENLQVITHRENSLKNNNVYSSKFRGVHLKKDKYKDKIYFSWVAQILINGIHNYLGVFKTEIEACNAYQNALKNI
jgi:hypothetical protein